MPSPRQESAIGRRVQLYSAAYKLAWELIPSLQKRAIPESLRIHASIRRQLKEGATDSRTFAFAAVKEVLAPDTP